MVELRSERRVETEEIPSASGARVDTSRGRTLERLEAPAPPVFPSPRIREFRNPAKNNRQLYHLNHLGVFCRELSVSSPSPSSAGTSARSGARLQAFCAKPASQPASQQTMGGLPVVTLATGGSCMPVIGMGTVSYPPAAPDATRAAILRAIGLGYRHFDTAAIYGTEQPLGEAIAEALRQGLVGSREDLFVTTKLWCNDAHPGLVVPALTNSLRNLGLDYVDLYLVHLPVSAKPGKLEVQIKDEDFMTFDMASVWEGMEQCHRLGLAKSVGVSNFSCKKLALLLETASIPPSVNQVEMNPLWQQQKLREFCAAKGIHVNAYFPLGGSRTPFCPNNLVMENTILKEIAEATGKTIAQKRFTYIVACVDMCLICVVWGLEVCLRWAYEQGVSMLVKSFNEKRMEENLSLFDWELNEEDRHKISQIPQHKSLTLSEFCGQYKSLTELWDGEI
ncbi:hypothetical protein Taro_055437 [Colocasia esculenta]|uniref:NADP-dependent oxidoreductase domain-containing protein n=1 Tax=Colocasia esculenta TaxID=4460 RepID=A0A843XU75_COLES|nr:hypothetical protein [Colocasia esculenta]